MPHEQNLHQTIPLFFGGKVLSSGIIMFRICLSSFSSTSSTTYMGTITFAVVVVPLIFITFINVVITLRLKTCSSNNKGKHVLSLPPGPVPWPIIGSLPELFRNKPIFRWLHHLMKEKNTEIGCVRFGNVHVILVSCYKIALEFLKEQDVLFASRPKNLASSIISRGYLDTGLAPFGDQWKKMRKVVTLEVVSPARHQWLHDKRMEEANNLVKYVFNQCTSTTRLVNIRTASRHYTGNVTRKMLFNKRYFGEGMKDGGPGLEEEEHVDAIFKALRYIYSFCISDYFPFLIGLDLDGQEKHVKEAYSVINKYHDPIIDERVKQNFNKNNTVDDQKMEPNDLLDVLISLQGTDGKPLLSPDEIKAQVTEIMIAAIDNSSNAVEWALAEMINQPKLLQQGIEELNMVVGKERLVQESDIPNLNFLKACARESFRIHPVAPYNLPHVAMSDTTVAGYLIPKGSHVLLSRIGLGQNPKVWDDPLKFKPERHLITNECGSNKVVLTEPSLRFISFSTGRRGCVASTLGTTMIIMLLARLLQGFTWSLPPNVSSIDLSESEDDLFLAKPLVLHAMPCLPLHLYPTN